MSACHEQMTAEHKNYEYKQRPLSSNSENREKEYQKNGQDTSDKHPYAMASHLTPPISLSAEYLQEKKPAQLSSTSRTPDHVSPTVPPPVSRQAYRRHRLTSAIPHNFFRFIILKIFLRFLINQQTAKHRLLLFLYLWPLQQER